MFVCVCVSERAREREGESRQTYDGTRERMRVHKEFVHWQVLRLRVQDRREHKRDAVWRELYRTGTVSQETRTGVLKILQMEACE